VKLCYLEGRREIEDVLKTTLLSGGKKRDRGCFENKVLRRMCAFRRCIARKQKELHDFQKDIFYIYM
jgi:hypothetical protein